MDNFLHDYLHMSVGPLNGISYTPHDAPLIAESL